MKTMGISSFDCQNKIIQLIDSTIQERINTTTKNYDFQSEISTNYEHYNSDSTEFSFVIFFKKNINEDNYGYSLDFEIKDNTDFVQIRSLLTNGIGGVISDWRVLSISKEADFSQLESLIFEYGIIIDLLIKEFILAERYSS